MAFSNLAVAESAIERINPRFSIVIPAHNEVDNLELLVTEIREALKTANLASHQYEILVVDDGSTDGTTSLVDRLEKSELIRGVRHHKNKGYGAALRSGFSQASGDYIAFIDGDRQLLASDLPRLFPLASENTLVLGYRAFRSDPLHRVILGKAFSRVFVPLTLGVHVRDVDCALKVIPRKLIEKAKLISSGALINAELLGISKRLGYRVREIPVSHRGREHGEQSGADFFVIARVFKELFSIRKRIRSYKSHASRKNIGSITGVIRLNTKKA